MRSIFDVLKPGYDQLKKAGYLKEIYPTLSGDWDKDCVSYAELRGFIGQEI